MPYMKLPDGSYFKVPTGIDFTEAVQLAQQKFPTLYGIKQQHGFAGALKSGLKEGIGGGLRGLADLTGSTALEQYGQNLLAPSTEPGAWKPTTKEETAEAFKQGILPGVGRAFSQYVSEPVGGMIGRYAIPTAAGAAVAVVAPEAGIPAALARGAGFIATDFPMEQGANIAEQEAVARQAALEGRAAPQTDRATTLMTSLAQAALLPVLGGLGRKGMEAMRLMGPDLAKTATAVANGQMTREAAIQTLNSQAKNYAMKSIEAGAVGVPLMVGTEAMRMAQAGEDLSSPEAQARLREATGAAIAGAPVFGALGAFGMRGRQEKMLGKAEDAFGRTWADAQQEQATRLEQDARDAAWQKAAKAGVTKTGDLFADTKMPKQPKGGYQGALPEEQQFVIDRAFFNQMGVANKGDGKELRERFIGKSLTDPAVAAEVKAALETYAENHPSAATKVEAGLKHPAFVLPEVSEARAPEQMYLNDARVYEQERAIQPLEPPSAEASRAAYYSERAQPFMEEIAATEAQQAQAKADWVAKMAAARAAAKAKQPPTQPGMVRDMFTGEERPVAEAPIAEAPAIEAPRTPEEQMWLNDARVYEQERAIQPLEPPSAEVSRTAYYIDRGEPLLTEEHRAAQGERAREQLRAEAAARDEQAKATEAAAQQRGVDLQAKIAELEAERATADKNRKAQIKRQVAKLQAEADQAKTEAGKSWTEMVPTEAERAAAVEPDIGATTTLKTSKIGQAAEPESLFELAPLVQTLKEASAGKGGFEAQRLWWDDLAWMARNKDTPWVAEAIAKGLTDRSFTKGDLSRAVKINAKHMAENRKMAEAHRVREARRIENDKQLHKATRETRDAAKLARDYERQLEAQTKAKRQQELADADAARHAAERAAKGKEATPEPEAASEAPTEVTGTEARLAAMGEEKQTATVQSIRQAATELAGEGWNQNKLQVFDSVSDLPADVRRLFKQDTQALAFRGSQAFLVASRIPKGQERAVILHEVGEHVGLEKLLGSKEKVTELATEVLSWRQRAGTVEQSAVRNAEARIPRDTPPHLRYKELIAYTAEELMKKGVRPRPDTLGGQFLAYIRNLVKGALTKLGMGKPLEGQDLIDLLHGAVREELGAKGKRGAKPVAERGEVMYAKFGAPSRVFAAKEQPKKLLDRMLEYSGLGERSFTDAAANAFLGKAHSLLGKTHRAGDTGAYSKINLGRVSAEAANAQGNNAIGVVSQAMAIGHMVIDKMGRVKAVEDSKNNMHTLTDHYKNLRQALMSKGFTEEAQHAGDTNTVTNAMALAVFGPRLEQLVKLGQFEKSFYTAADKAFSDKLRADPELAPLIKQFHDTYNVMRGHAVDAVVESGIYTEAKAKEYMDRAEYLPLYRMDESLQNTLGEPTHLNSLLTAAKEHHLGAGSAASIGDPMTNAFNNLVWLNMRAVKNNTANILGESLVAVGAAKWRKFGSPNDRYVVSFNRKGETVHLHLNDLNDASAFTAAPVMTGIGWHIGRSLSNMVRKGVTIMPGFVWGQTSQDAQRVAIRTGQGFARAYLDVGTGLLKGIKGETVEQKILRSYGVIAARDFSDGMDTFRREMLERDVSPWKQALQKVESVAMASDGAAREAAYKKTFAETGDEFAAQHAARMLIDFNNRGNSRTLAALMTVVPFINARIQGTHRMVDALTGKIPGMNKEDAMRMVYRQVGKLMAFTLAHTLYNMGDDEYENQTTATRNNNFMFPGNLKMPVASELLPFKVLAETTARQMMDDPNEDWHKSRAAITSAASSILLGPSDMMPSLARPIVEHATNHSFFTGHALIGKSMESKSASQQYNQSTTELSKGLASGLESAMQVLGFEKGVSPIIIENYLTAWTGRTGIEALNLLRMIESAVGERPAPRLHETPMVGAFFINPQGNAVRSDFQEIADRVRTAEANLKDLRDRGNFEEARQYQQENRHLLNLSGRVNAIGNQLAALNKTAKRGDMTEEKRNQIYTRQQQLLQQTYDLRRDAGF